MRPNTLDSALDPLDRALLASLQANARESVANLARQLGVARTTVLARIARLEKNGVIGGYGIRLGKPLEDRALTAWCGITVEPKAGPGIIRRLQRLPEVQELSAVSGQFDYVALLRAPSADRLDALLDEIGSTDGVRNTTTSIVLARKIDRRSEVLGAPEAKRRAG